MYETNNYSKNVLLFLEQKLLCRTAVVRLLHAILAWGCVMCIV